MSLQSDGNVARHPLQCVQGITRIDPPAAGILLESMAEKNCTRGGGCSSPFEDGASRGVGVGIKTDNGP